MAIPHITSDAPSTGVLSGGQTTLSVAWDLAPGTPDAPVTATITQDGIARAVLTGIFKGAPGETKPTLVLNAASGWSLTVDKGNVTAGVDSDHWVWHNV